MFPRHFYQEPKSIIELGGILSMNTKWDDTSWQEEFLEMKTHKPDVVRLLMEGPRGFRDAWQLGALHEEYKRLKKRYQQLQQEHEQREQQE